MLVFLLFLKINNFNLIKKIYFLFGYSIFRKICFQKLLSTLTNLFIYNLFIFLKLNIYFLFKFGKKNILVRSNILKNNLFFLLLEFFYFLNHKFFFFSNFLLSHFKKIYFIKKKLLMIKLGLKFKKFVFLRKRKTKKYIGEKYFDWYGKKNFKKINIIGHATRQFPLNYIKNAHSVNFKFRKFNIGAEFLLNRFRNRDKGAKKLSFKSKYLFELDYLLKLSLLLSKKKIIKKNLNFYSKMKSEYYFSKKLAPKKIFNRKKFRVRKIFYLNKKIFTKYNVLVYDNYYQKLKQIYLRSILNLKLNFKNYNKRLKKKKKLFLKIFFFFDNKMINHAAYYRIYELKGKLSRKLKDKKKIKFFEILFLY